MESFLESFRWDWFPNVISSFLELAPDVRALLVAKLTLLTVDEADDALKDPINDPAYMHIAWKLPALRCGIHW